MPLLPDLDNYLNQMMRRYGLPGRRTEPLPLATRALPRIRPEQIYAQKVEEPGRGFWETAFDVLRSGEYAINSFLESVFQGEKAKADPLTSLVHGFAAGFSDDPTYKRTMFNVMTAMGWNPQEGTFGETAKTVTSFLAGILADPLTYLTLGPAAKALRIGGKTIKEVAEAAGIKNVERWASFAKGQALSKSGRKVHKAFVAARMAAEPLSAGQTALADITKLILPNELIAGTRGAFLKGGFKSPELAKEALEALGREATPAAIKEFIEKGYRELLDKGGLKWFGKLLVGPSEGYLTPRASSLHGLLLGESISSNMPLMHKLGAKVKTSKAWEEIVTKRLGRMFNRFGLIPEHMRPLVIRLNSARRQGDELTQGMVKNLMLVDDQIIKHVPTPIGDIPMVSTKAHSLKLKEQQFLAKIMPEARMRGEAGPRLEQFLRNAMNDEGHRFHGWAKEAGLAFAPEKIQRGIVSVGTRIQGFLKKLRKWEIQNGLGDSLVPAYFPRTYKSQKKFTEEQAQAFAQRDPWFFDRTQTKTIGYEESKVLAKQGSKEIPGELRTDLPEILRARIATTFSHAYQRDALQAMVEAGVAQAPGIMKGLDKLMKDRRFLEKYPQIAQLVGEYSTKYGVEATKVFSSKKLGTMGFQGLVDQMIKIHDPDAIRSLAEKWMKTELPRNITQNNVEALMALYRGAMHRKADLIPAASAEGKVQIQSALKAMSDQEPLIRGALSQQVLDKRLAGLKQDLMRQLGKEGVEGAEKAKVTRGLKKVAAAEELRDVIKKSGAEDHLSAIVKRFDTGKSLENLSERRLKQIKAELQKAPSNAAAAQKLLRPTQLKVRTADISARYKVSDPFTGKPRNFKDFDVPAGLAKEIERSVEPERLKKWAQYIAVATQPFKKLVTSTSLLGMARPAFFVRNMIDLGFRGTMGMGMRFWTDIKKNFPDAAKILLGRDGSLEIDGVRLTYQHIRDALVQGDLYRKGFEKIDARSHGILDKIIEYISEDKAYVFRHWKNEFHRRLDQIPILRRLGPERMGEYMENMAVVHGLLSQLRAGIPMDQALDGLRKHLFAFNNLTTFERNVMRSLFPFYSFSRQAIPFLSFRAAKRPALLTALPKISSMDSLTKEEEAVIPQWVRDYPHVSVMSTRKGFMIASLRNIFTVDVIDDVMQDLNADGFRKFISQMNPILMAPMELLLGRDLYLNEPIEKERRKLLWRGLESETMRDSPLGKFLNARPVTIKGRKYIAVDSQAHHVISKMWFSRLYRELDAVFSLLEKKLNPLEISGLLTGIKLREIDMDRQRRILMYDSENVTRQYNAARRRGDDVAAKRILEEYRLK